MKFFLSWPAYVVATALFFVGERLLGAGHDLRAPVSGVGLLWLLAWWGWRVGRLLRAAAEHRPALRPSVLSGAAALLGLTLYGLTLKEGLLSDDLLLAARVGWPIAWLAGSLGLVLGEWALAEMANAETLEVRRVQDSSRTGVGLGLALSLLVAVNFVADQKNERIDLRDRGQLSPSAGTLELARNLTSPVTITLLFPPANDVAEQVTPYFEAVKAASSQITLVSFDKDRHPERAKEIKARKNGSVVISQGANHLTLTLDVDPDKARSRLKKLDADVRENLIKATQPARVAYVITGHGERSLSPRDGEPPGLKDAQEILEALNFSVKKLGLEQGLSSQVPADATVVLWVGPRGPLFPAEMDALIRYVKGGGALFVALDPEIEKPLEVEPLLAMLGVSWDPAVQVNPGKFVRLTNAATDQRVVFTSRFTPHASISTLAAARTQALLIFPTTGSLGQAANPGGAEVHLTSRAMAGTYADRDGDLSMDGDEKPDTPALTAAVQLPIDGGDKGGRVVITADADVLSDLILRRSPANQQFMIDALNWLLGDVKLAPDVAPEEDVPIVHTRDEDKLWFYGMSLGVPMALLGVGAALSRRRRA